MKTTSELSKSLESTRAHLQGQLRNKEAENNRLSVQIKVDCFIFPVYTLFLQTVYEKDPNEISEILNT